MPKTYKLPQVGQLPRALQEPTSTLHPRPCDVDTLLRQITTPVVLRVSGGRVKKVILHTAPGIPEQVIGVFLPITNFVGVRVLYTKGDLYHVQRVRTHKNGSITIEREFASVYAEQLPELVIHCEDGG